MRKLTVKNFSVIKEAELEFGKITVLIGPQASGKSLLCKLAYFLDREAIKIAIDLVVNRLEFSEFESAVKKEFSKWFPNGGWGNKDWSIRFVSDQYNVTLSAPSSLAETPDLILSFAEVFKAAYTARLEETQQEQNKRGFLIGSALQSLAATRLMAIAGRGIWDASTYIPLERSYFVDTKKGYRSLAADSDKISSYFADVFANCLSSNFSKARAVRYLKGDITSFQSEWMLAFNDGRFLPLSDLSSGSKEMLPILLALDYYEGQRRQSGNLPAAELYDQKLYFFDDFTIEEPEASVFPQTQYDLVQEFAALSNESDFQPHFTITTHSPYILSVFGDLVKAGKVGAQSAEHHGAVAKVIPEKYWIKDSDFAAYKIEDGTLVSIFDNESGQIDGDYLDNVSGKISDELGQLLEIQYGR